MSKNDKMGELPCFDIPGLLPQQMLSMGVGSMLNTDPSIASQWIEQTSGATHGTGRHLAGDSCNLDAAAATVAVSPAARTTFRE